jgi:hypothetical protein
LLVCDDTRTGVPKEDPPSRDCTQKVSTRELAGPVRLATVPMGTLHGVPVATSWLSR